MKNLLSVASPFLLAASLGPLLFVVGAGCDVGQTSNPTASGGGGAGGDTSSSGAAQTVGSGGPGTTSGAGSSTTGSSGSGGAPPNSGYYTEGPLIKKSDGTPHVFHGVARPSLEWNDKGEMLSADDYQRMAGWKANVVRIALNQQFWLKNDAYEATVDQNVAWAKAAGMDVILDLHWSDTGDLNMPAGQQRMADANSVTFWQEVATKYKEDGRVLFELYNEPHDVAWDVWRNGGQSGDGFQVHGMQELYDTVRAAGANNLVLIGGLNYAYDLSGVPQFKVNGYNIVYVTHAYDFPGKQPQDWYDDWGFLAKTDPVMMTEFGVINGSCDANYYSQAIQFADQNNVSWTAWAWYVNGCTFPSLITTWNGDPSAAGQVVKGALASY